MNNDKLFMQGNILQSWEPLKIQGHPLITMGVAAYNRVDPLLCLIYSLKSQTYKNWELIICHDGPNELVKRSVINVADSRIVYEESQERVGGWHAHRQHMIDVAKGDYICMSNDDNYYCPVYFEWMIHEHQRTGADFVYCNMVHSHFKWADFRSLPYKHAIDLGAWTATRELVKNTPWVDLEIEGDGTYVEQLINKSRRKVLVPGYLFVHN